MTEKKRRRHGNIYNDLKYHSSVLINPTVISYVNNNFIVIWLDKSVEENKPDDQYTIQQLYLIKNSIVIFTNEQTCLQLITNLRADKKSLFLVVSGSLGKVFVPNINEFSCINSIYVFCANKSNHEQWATNYKKIKGVFNNILDLCKQLDRDIKRFEFSAIVNDKSINSFPKKYFLPYQFNEIVDQYTIPYSIYQPNDDIQIAMESASIPFSNETDYLLANKNQVQSEIVPSQTVIPFDEHHQQDEFLDNGKENLK